MNRVLNCVFCKILRGEIPSTQILETDRVIVILDINPVVKGHLLIIPRDHFPQLCDLPDDLSGHIGGLLPRLSGAVVSAVGADGSNVVINSGGVAGQTIDHCHWHIIPRFQGDAVHWPWPHDAYDAGEMIGTASRIIASLDW